MRVLLTRIHNANCHGIDSVVEVSPIEQEARQIMVVKAEVTAQPPGHAVNPSLGIASLLCTVPVAAPQPLPLRHRSFTHQSTFHQTFRWHRAGVGVWCEGLS